MRRAFLPPFVLAIAVSCVLAADPRAAAQAPAEAAAPGAQASPQRATSPSVSIPPPVASSPTIDCSTLRRIRRELAETPPTHSSGALSLLKLNYYVEVVGKAPRYDFLTGFNVGRGTPVQYGAMTHDEFLRLAAPPWRRLSW